MPRKLPPLNAIRAFEASARLGGFVAASQELGVTPGAVSMQIRKLEEYYDVALFRRFASGVELTEVGGTIFGECSSALSALPKTLERFHMEIKLHQEDVKKYGRAKQSQKYNDAKNDARKFLQQGRKVLTNVEKGQFPGSY